MLFRSAPVRALVVNPADGRVTTIDRNGFLKVFDPINWVIHLDRQLAGNPHLGNTELCWQPGGTRLAVSDGPRALVVLDGKTGTILKRLEQAKPIGGADWHPDGRRLLVASGKQILTWDTVTGDTSVLGDLPLPGNQVLQDARWLPDGQVAACRHGTIFLVNPSTGTIKPLPAPPAALGLDILSSTGLAATAATDTGVYI